MDTPGDASTVAVTGVGSMPGTDPVEAARIVAGELDVPHLAELPARGPGADMLGRTLALVCAATGEFAAATTPAGGRWRAVGPAGSPAARCGWALPGSRRIRSASRKCSTGSPDRQGAGDRAVDAGRGDRVCRRHPRARRSRCVRGRWPRRWPRRRPCTCDSCARRVPGRTVLAQIDEPRLPAVQAGRIRTASGRGAIRTPEPSELAPRGWRRRRRGRGEGGAAEARPAHCCARGRSVRRAGPRRHRDAQRRPRALVGHGPTRTSASGGTAGGAVDPRGGALDRSRCRRAPRHARGAGPDRRRRSGAGSASASLTWGSARWLSPACGLAGASPAGPRRRAARCASGPDAAVSRLTPKVTARPHMADPWRVSAESCQLTGRVPRPRFWAAAAPGR